MVEGLEDVEEGGGWFSRLRAMGSGILIVGLCT